MKREWELLGEEGTVLWGGGGCSGVCRAMSVCHVSVTSMLCLLYSRHCNLKHRGKKLQGTVMVDSIVALTVLEDMENG